MQYRTDHPKYAQYRGDGMGRDTYIIMNNGGFLEYRRQKGQQKKQGFSLTSRISPIKPNAVLSKEPAQVYYPPDGSGRDSYIITSNGGTTRPFRNGTIDFKQCNYLRDNKHVKCETPYMNQRLLQQTNPTVTSYSFWPSKAAIAHNRATLRKNIEVVDRLSPKRDFSSPGKIYGHFSDRKFSSQLSRQVPLGDDMMGQDKIREKV